MPALFAVDPLLRSLPAGNTMVLFESMSCRSYSEVDARSVVVGAGTRAKIMIPQGLQRLPSVDAIYRK
jgi:hypothetical protein